MTGRKKPPEIPPGPQRRTGARILWHRLNYKEPFNPEVFAPAEARMKRQKLARLQTQAGALNYQLVPQPWIPTT